MSRHVPDTLPMICPSYSMLLPILNGSLLSANMRRLTDEHLAESRHFFSPHTLRPNDLPPLVNVSTYSEKRPVVVRLAAPCPDTIRLNFLSAHLSQCFYLFWTAPCCRQTCSAWLTSTVEPPRLKDLPLLVNASTYSEQRPVVGRLAVLYW